MQEQTNSIIKSDLKHLIRVENLNKIKEILKKLEEHSVIYIGFQDINVGFQDAKLEFSFKDKPHKLPNDWYKDFLKYGKFYNLVYRYNRKERLAVIENIPKLCRYYPRTGIVELGYFVLPFSEKQKSAQILTLDLVRDLFSLRPRPQKW